MTEAVLVVDRNGETVTTNRAYVASFGSDRPLVPEDGSGVRLPEDEWPQARAARGETFAMSFARVDASGDRRWYEASGQPGGNWGGIVVIRDITERSLRHLQERFIDTASHELQTPLAALHNYLQLVDRNAGGLDDAARRYLTGALEQSRYLAELAARLFDVSLIRHGRVVVARGPVELRELVSTTVEDMRNLYPNVPVELNGGNRRVVVSGDRLRLRQVLTNLLVNALTHGASSSAVEVSLRVQGGDAVMTVADRGRGIAPEALPQLFTPFAAVSTDAGSGLGLGLFLAREISVEHGGTLVVQAREGGGTIARVTLPLAGDAATRARARRSRSRKQAAS
jgi:two-component system CheB/CheR fusion protein